MPVGSMFEIDNSDYKRLEQFFKRAPKKAAVVTGMMLNEFAVGTREEVFKYMPEKMTIRRPGFLRSRIQYTKSRYSLPIGSQASIVGSVPVGKFKGWAEQGAGLPAQRKRLATIKGRRGNQKNIIPQRFRLRKRFESPKYFPGGSPSRRAMTMLLMLDRQEFKGPFILVGHPNATDGLYQFRSGKLVMLQNFESDKLQPERLPWLTDSRARYFLKTDMNKLWGQKLKRVLKFK